MRRASRRLAGEIEWIEAHPNQSRLDIDQEQARRPGEGAKETSVSDDDAAEIIERLRVLARKRALEDSRDIWISLRDTVAAVEEQCEQPEILENSGKAERKTGFQPEPPKSPENTR
jgi:hypothetical protein